MIKQIKQLTSKALKHPIISAFIAGAALIPFTPLLSGISYTTMLSAIYNFIAGILSSVAAWFSQDITMQLWLLILIGLALLIAIPLAMSIYESKAEKENDLAFIAYTQDSILGIKWSWEWRQERNGNYVHSTPLARCPKCSAILREGGTYSFAMQCAQFDCGWAWRNPTNQYSSNYIGNIHALQQYITNSIDRKLTQEEERVNKASKATA